MKVVTSFITAYAIGSCANAATPGRKYNGGSRSSGAAMRRVQSSSSSPTVSPQPSVAARKLQETTSPTVSLKPSGEARKLQET
eukprot:CAMPEP_0172415722 /NCGR_PEP_ID=MMETSP1064-20121228/2148_1 /TAXON_ID=202472 /ORGANISM="Aulacoseira subarctica , Strain CCAP 1002/5" /LENGTH=82 /DNA_ID=CAMNT_0013152889 /DNA_START=73 /DNA_END=317 /DNA_ORIENTATION=-